MSTPRTSDNTTQQSTASSQTTASQSGHDQYQEISRWSPNTSSLATSTAGGSSSRASAQHSTGASTVNSTAATHGSVASNTTTSTDGVDVARERTLLALEHGGQPAPPSERTGEDLISRVTRDPQAAQLMSSSGTRARDRREDEDS
ncbi:hypothetical protein EMCG_00910 [[Emmonsia] crescens]|uniref:Uncharacterized protein n=1 Tax=[Emmonsia] crescens TaxID=73230 RepID=A0A0G2HPX6_9EURO|nr:hypothetical protein EMCG_00910 [Emmonsia crescens UAMH 3008]